MNKELTKSLNDLIDETLSELEELKKSRFAAAEVEIKGPGEGISGKPSNGDLHAKKEDKDEDEDKKDKKDDKDMDKGEGVNRQADPNGGHHQVDKGEGTNRQADPNGGHHQMDKAEDDKDKDDKDKKDKKDKKDDKKDDDKKMPMFGKEDMKKAQEESESLMKSYVDDKIKPLEGKLSTILDLVNKLSEQPVAPKGTTARTTPLFKSDAEAGEPLMKHEVASKLFDLKKSGTRVDSLDVTKAEMGQDLESIVKKYKLS
jgi:hypothetical protein